jgi:hypothetical protein
MIYALNILLCSLIHQPDRKEERKEGRKERRGKENNFMPEKRRKANFVQIVEVFALFVPIFWSK